MSRLIHLLKNPWARLAVNFSYAAGNCALGFLTHSWWFITVGAYYAVKKSRHQAALCYYNVLSQASIRAAVRS